MKKSLKVKLYKRGGRDMLIRFNVKNYLSFSSREDGTSEEFSMIAGKMKSKKEHLYEQTNAKLLKIWYISK